MNRAINIFLNLDSSLQEKILQASEENLIFIFKLCIRLHRFRTYRIFKTHDMLKLYNGKILYNASVSTIFCALEWFLFIPFIEYEKSHILLFVYKAILREMFENGDIEHTLGWENKYIRKALEYWMDAEIPLIGQYMGKEDIEEADPFVWGSLIIENSIKRKIQVNGNNTVISLKKPGKYSKCIYCIHDYGCFAHSENNENGPCSKDLNIKSRCNKDCGVHLCNAHGHKILLKRHLNQDNNNEERYTFKLKDNRIINHLGWLKENNLIFKDFSYYISYEKIIYYLLCPKKHDDITFCNCLNLDISLLNKKTLEFYTLGTA